jgi:hypothetical protein
MLMSNFANVLTWFATHIYINILIHTSLPEVELGALK